MSAITLSNPIGAHAKPSTSSTVPFIIHLQSSLCRSNQFYVMHSLLAQYLGFNSNCVSSARQPGILLNSNSPFIDTQRLVRLYFSYYMLLIHLSPSALILRSCLCGISLLLPYLIKTKTKLL